MDPELEKLLEKLGLSIDEYKELGQKEVDELKTQLKEIAAKSSTTELEHKQVVGELLERIDALETKSNRPGNGLSQEAEEYKTGFGNFMRKGDESEIATKAVNVGNNNDGGFAVPEELDRNLLTVLRDESPMRQVCSQITVGTDGYTRLVNVGGAGSGWVGETDARDETGTPTISQISAFMGEIYANPQASQKSLDDIFFDVEAWITGEVGIEFAEREGAAFLSGDGSNKPKGLLAYPMTTQDDANRAFGTIQKVESSAAGDFDADDLINLVYALKSKHRRNGQFMMATTTIKKIRKLKDSDGNYLWAAGLQAGEPSTLIGFPVIENEDMPAVAAGSNAILFADFKRSYAVVDRFGTRMLRDPYTNKPNVGFYTTKRVGGMLLDSNAVKVLSLKA